MRIIGEVGGYSAPVHVGMGWANKNGVDDSDVGLCRIFSLVMPTHRCVNEGNCSCMRRRNAAALYPYFYCQLMRPALRAGMCDPVQVMSEEK